MIAILAAALAAAQPVTVGKWAIISDLDPMTDQKKCYVSYDGNPHIQLTREGGMFISYSGRGGIRSYRLRIGNEPASELRLVSDRERRSDAIQFRDPVEFDRIVRSGRLRVETLTYLNVIQEDIDLTDVPAARQTMAANGCL